MNKSRFKKAAVMCLCLIAALTGLLKAAAKPVEVTSAIKTVTVFKGHAHAQRVVHRTFEPGIYTLKLPHLPVGLLDSSVRVSGKGTANAKILNVKIKKEFLAEAGKKEVKVLEAQKKEIDTRIIALVDKLTALQKRQDMLVKLSEKTADSISNEKNVTTPPLQDWKGMLDFLETQTFDVSNRRREIERKKELLDQQKRLITQKLDQFRNARKKEEKTVLVDVEVTNAGDLTVTTSYIVPGAGWAPMYDLRIDSTAKSAGLTYAAMVTQETGEDWKDVRLTFSTARPLVVKQIPKLSPIIMDIYRSYNGEIYGRVTLEDGSQIPGVTVTLKGMYADERTTVTDANGEFRFFSLTSGTYDLTYYLEGFRSVHQNGVQVFDDKISKPQVTMETVAIRQEIVVSGKVPTLDRRSTTKSTIFGADGTRNSSGWSGGGGGYSKGKTKTQEISAHNVRVENKIKTAKPASAAITGTEHGVSLSFSIKHKETVLSNRDAQKATIGVQNPDIRLEHVAVPRRSEYTFLKATVKNTSETPFLPGRMNVFFNGTFVNTTSVDYINPGDSFELAVGVDEGVKVTRENISVKEDVKGVFKKKSRKHLGYKILAKNYHKNTVTLNLIDQLPVSKNEKIQIVNVSLHPEPEPVKEDKAKKAKKDGILKWVLKLNPGETKTVRVEYDVVHPEGVDVEERS